MRGTGKLSSLYNSWKQLIKQMRIIKIINTNMRISVNSTVDRFPEMLHVLMSNRTNPLSHADARTVLTRLAHEFDENFDGKFSYAGQCPVSSCHVSPFHLKLGFHIE